MAEAATPREAPSAAGVVAAAQRGPEQQVSPAQRQLIALGQIVSVAMDSKQHGSMTIAELRVRLLPAIESGQYVLASRRSGGGAASKPIAAALWASVSDAVDKRLSSGGPHEMRLERAEWTGGPHVWLVDVFGDAKALPGILQSLGQTKLQGRAVKMFARDASGAMRVHELRAQ